MKYLITGGAGFIGSHLSDFLILNGHQVIIIDNLSSGNLHNVNSQADFILGDILDVELISSLMKDIDGCFHLAAVASVEISKQNWFYTNQVNLAGSINIFEQAAKNKVKVVYASSAAIYGDNHNLPLSENDLPTPINNYGIDKYGNELHAKNGAHIHQLNSVGLRFFNVYGPRQDPNSPYSGVISIFADQITQGKKIKIYGDGLQSRDFIYISDVVNFLNNSMELELNGAEILNVCSGKFTSVLDVANYIAEITGQKLEIEFQAFREGDIKHSYGSPDRAKKILNTYFQIELQEGLKYYLTK